MGRQLSEGAVAALVQGKEAVAFILHVIDFRPISTRSGTTFYRLLVREGVHTLESFLLAPQLAPLVANKRLVPNAICKINQYTVNTVKDGRRVFIITDLEVIRCADPMATKIGNPVPYFGGNMPKYFCPPKMPGTFGGLKLLTTPGGTQLRVVPIASLNPYQLRWTICARVTQKSQVQTWSSLHGEEKLFFVELVDETGEIRAIAFNKQVDNFFPLIELNKVYYFSNGNLEKANKLYSFVKNDYKITFTNYMSIIPCTDADHLPYVQYNFVPIGDLEEVKENSAVDVPGVCTNWEEAASITLTSSNQKTAKRDIWLLDTSGKTVTATFWGNEAEKFDGSQSPVVAIKRARVSDLGGRSLIVPASSTLTVNPNCPEAFQLKAWFNREGNLLVSSSISNTPGASSTGGYINWKSLREAKTEHLGKGDKVDYYCCVCTIVDIRMLLLYKTCPNQGCNKRLTDNKNRLYHCEKCDQKFLNVKYCFILGVNIVDVQESLWILCFKQAVEKILGHDEAYLGELHEKDKHAFEKVLENANFTTYEFWMRVQEKTFKAHTQQIATVVDVRPVDHQEHCRRLITSIRKNASTVLG